MTTKIYTLRTNHELYKKLYDENVSLKLKNNMHNDNILMIFFILYCYIYDIKYNYFYFITY